MKAFFYILSILLFTACNGTNPSNYSPENEGEIVNHTEKGNSENIVENSKPLEIPNKEFAVYKYDTTLKSEILTYQYNLWDLDNDDQKDSIEFISNGGAHAYYHLRIKVSSETKWKLFPTFLIDFPYSFEIDNLQELESIYPQLVVQDFDSDGVDKIYLNLNNDFASIPNHLLEMESNSNRILIDFYNGELMVKDFKK
ncbi:MAG: hypothetical protein KDC92_02660 [Bacteroidetes bacterium]|nr:hypothetical protein [Bacteroidota bacterium]